MKNKQRVILVIGVNRSGTSVLTKSLEVMGVSLGPAFDMTDSFDEHTTWEDWDFHALNLEMLKWLGKDRVRHTLSIDEKEAELLSAEGFLTKASELLRSKLPTAKPLGIKDPRFSLLLPFWKKVFTACDLRLSFVIALRNPWSTAASKKQHLEKSFWEWISYLLSGLEHSKGHERLLVDYDALIEHPTQQIERIAQGLQLSLSATSHSADPHPLINPAWRHFHEEKKEATSFYEQVAMEMYEHLLAIAKDQATFEALEEPLKKWKDLFLNVEALLMLAEKNAFTLQQLRKKIQQRDQSIQELNKTVHEKLKTIADSYQTIHQRELQIAFLAQGHAAREATIVQLKEKLQPHRN